MRKAIKDPLDIDDDISDHGPDSTEQQLQQLDGMNKYLQNVRVPTSKIYLYLNIFLIGFADDGFISLNGTNADKAYTLERLRHEQKIMDGGYIEEPRDIEGQSNSGSTYELVEEMYENMSSFDRKIKTMNGGGHHQQQRFY